MREEDGEDFIVSPEVLSLKMLAPWLNLDTFDVSLLPCGVTVTQRPLEALFMVRIHAGQPL